MKEVSNIIKNSFENLHKEYNEILELKNELNLFKDIIEDVNDMIQILKSDGSFLYVNHSWLKTFGYKRNEVKGLTIKDILYGKRKDICNKVYKEILSGKKIKAIEVELITKYKKRIFVEICANSKLLSDKNIYIYCILKDISKRKKAEMELKGLLEMSESILKAIPHAVVGLKKRKIFFANEAVETVFGWKPNEIIGKSTKIFYRNEKDYHKIADIFYPILEKQNTYSCEFPCRKKDGTNILCNVSAAVIGKKMKDRTIVVMYEDITKRRVIENELKLSREKYFDLYQNAPFGYCSFREDGKIEDINKTLVRMLGYKNDELPDDLNIKEIVQDKKDEILSTLIKNRKIEDLECVLRKRDGSLLPVLLSSSNIYDSFGKFLSSRAVLRDISSRVEYRKNLERAIREWKTTFDALPCGILLIDKDMYILRVNKFIVDLYRVNYKNIIGQKYYTFLYKTNSPGESCPFMKMLLTEKTEKDEYYSEEMKKHFMIQSTPVYDENDKINSGVITIIDITDIKEKEKKLIESRDAFLNILSDLDFSYKELKMLFDGFIHAFINAIDAKSPWTKGHSERVTEYSLAIAKELGLNDFELEDLKIAGLLHDIGKIGTYDIILDKPVRLTPEEYNLINQHPVKGEQILKPIKQLKHILPIIRHHHERFDGKGYPDGLKGEEIPLLSRIICVADSYDSMTSDRPYRDAAIKEYAIYELKKCSGTQFDPKVVEAFLKVII